MKVFSLSVLAATVGRTSAFLPTTRAAAGRSATNAVGQRNLFNFFNRSPMSSTGQYPVMAEEAAMSAKAHGTSEKPVQKDLRWNCDNDTADRICNFNRHYAEFAGYWATTDFLKSKDAEEAEQQPIQFYDSVTGEQLFTAPVGRTMEEFVKESQGHGWPSFRDEEVNWEYVRCLANGECISTTGTHLGHNLPDRSGNRYCINLVSVAGSPEKK
jgi:peptide methionine sulfoxide reductase MsrB